MSITNARPALGNSFGNRFGTAAAAASGSSGNAQDRPKAEFWLNVGYPTGDETYPFISLPAGIPLDLSDMKNVTGKPEYANFVSAQNELLEQILDEAATLEPGEDRIFFTEDMPIGFQIRRVRGDVEVDSAANTLSRKNVFTSRSQEAANAASAMEQVPAE